MSIIILMYKYLSLKTFVLQRWWRGWWCLSHHESSHNPASHNLVNTSAEWTGLAWFGQLAIWATYEREYILHSYTCDKELWASSNSKVESAVFLWRANEFIPAESCSARLQLGSVFSQSNLIVPNLDQNPIQCSRCLSCAYSFFTGISAAASAANTHPHVNSKQRHCIFLWVTRVQSVSSAGFNRTFGICENSESFNALSKFKRAFPSRRRFKSTGCMASSRWLSTCTWLQTFLSTVTVALNFHLQRGPHRFKESPCTMRSSLMAVFNSLKWEAHAAIFLCISHHHPSSRHPRRSLQKMFCLWCSLLQSKLGCLNVAVSAEAPKDFVDGAVQHLPTQDLS